jgi:hypothetical protein
MRGHWLCLVYYPPETWPFTECLTQRRKGRKGLRQKWPSLGASLADYLVRHIGRHLFNPLAAFALLA